MGGPVAVVLVGVVVAALGPEEQGGQHKEAAAANQDRGKGEAVGVHRRGGADCLILPSFSAARSKGLVNCDQKVAWMQPQLSSSHLCMCVARRPTLSIDAQLFNCVMPSVSGD